MMIFYQMSHMTTNIHTRLFTRSNEILWDYKTLLKCVAILALLGKIKASGLSLLPSPISILHIYLKIQDFISTQKPKGLPSIKWTCKIWLLFLLLLFSCEKICFPGSYLKIVMENFKQIMKNHSMNSLDSFRSFSAH